MSSSWTWLSLMIWENKNKSLMIRTKLKTKIRRRFVFFFFHYMLREWVAHAISNENYEVFEMNFAGLWNPLSDCLWKFLNPKGKNFQSLLEQKIAACPAFWCGSTWWVIDWISSCCCHAIAGSASVGFFFFCCCCCCWRRSRMCGRNYGVGSVMEYWWNLFSCSSERSSGISSCRALSSTTLFLWSTYLCNPCQYGGDQIVGSCPLQVKSHHQYQQPTQHSTQPGRSKCLREDLL